MGQMLYVMGGIEELGNWQEYKCPMSWTEGHYWVANVDVKSGSYFQYKYVIVNEGGHEEPIWEGGIDRVADLAILPDRN